MGVVLALSLGSVRGNSRRGQRHLGPVLGGRAGEGEPGHRGVSLTCVQSGWLGSELSAAQVEAEVGLLRKACSLLRQRMEEELSAGERALVCVSGHGGLRDWRGPGLPSPTFA